MLVYINKKLIGFVIPVILFCFVFFSGCSSSKIETIDSDELASDHRSILEIKKIKLTNGDTLSSYHYNFSVKENKTGPVQLFCYLKNQLNTLDTNKYIYAYENFLISDIDSAVVLYKKKPNILLAIAGGVLLFFILGAVWAYFTGEGRKNPPKQ